MINKEKVISFRLKSKDFLLILNLAKKREIRISQLVREFVEAQLKIYGQVN